MLEAEQRRAIATALSRQVSIISGGPGVGKTTSIRVLVELLERRVVPYMLLSPTGKAAKRLAEATLREGALLRSIGPRTRLIFVGDKDQAGERRPWLGAARPDRQRPDPADAAHRHQAPGRGLTDRRGGARHQRQASASCWLDRGRRPVHPAPSLDCVRRPACWRQFLSSGIASARSPPRPGQPPATA